MFLDSKHMDFKVVDYHLKTKEEKVLMYYKGCFDDALLAKVNHFLRHAFSASPKAGKRLFAVFVEIGQNIGYYSAEHNYFDKQALPAGIGSVTIYETEDSYVFMAGNVLKRSALFTLYEKCDKINQLSYDELRALKREVRSLPLTEGQKGGNIGLIQIAIKSQSPLVIESQDIDENNAFFWISTEINKNQSDED